MKLEFHLKNFDTMDEILALSEKKNSTFFFSTEYKK